MAVAISSITVIRSSSKKSGGQLNSLVQSAVKMQTIRKDSTIPEALKQTLLAPLLKLNALSEQQANADVDAKRNSILVQASDETAAAAAQSGQEPTAEEAAGDGGDPSQIDWKPAVTASDVVPTYTPTAAPSTSPPAAPPGTHVDTFA